MSKNLHTKTSEFIKKSIEVHGNKFDYSKIEYTGYHKKVCILCPTHGEFYQAPSNHLAGKDCLKCSYEKRSQNSTHQLEYFLARAKSKHGGKYDYSKVKYVNSKTKVCIICHEIDKITGKKHMEFWQTPYSHLSGANCPLCTNSFLNQDIFIDRVRVLHNNRYDYSKDVFK